MVRKASNGPQATSSRASRSAIALANPQMKKSELQERIAQLESENAKLRGSAPRTNPHDDRSDLLHTIRALEQENDDLQDTLDQIADVAAAPADEDSLTADDLKEKLNSVIDLASDSDADEDEDDQEDDE